MATVSADVLLRLARVVHEACAKTGSSTTWVEKYDRIVEEGRKVLKMAPAAVGSGGLTKAATDAATSAAVARTAENNRRIAENKKAEAERQAAAAKLQQEQATAAKRAAGEAERLAVAAQAAATKTAADEAAAAEKAAAEATAAAEAQATAAAAAADKAAAEKAEAERIAAEKAAAVDQAAVKFQSAAKVYLAAVSQGHSSQTDPTDAQPTSDGENAPEAIVTKLVSLVSEYNGKRKSLKELAQSINVLFPAFSENEGETDAAYVERTLTEFVNFVNAPRRVSDEADGKSSALRVASPNPYDDGASYIHSSEYDDTEDGEYLHSYSNRQLLRATTNAGLGKPHRPSPHSGDHAPVAPSALSRATAFVGQTARTDANVTAADPTVRTPTLNAAAAARASEAPTAAEADGATEKNSSDSEDDSVKEVHPFRSLSSNTAVPRVASAASAARALPATATNAKPATDKAAADKAEAERIAAEKAEAERIAAAKAAAADEAAADKSAVHKLAELLQTAATQYKEVRLEHEQLLDVARRAMDPAGAQSEEEPSAVTAMLEQVLPVAKAFITRGAQAADHVTKLANLGLLERQEGQPDAEFAARVLKYALDMTLTDTEALTTENEVLANELEGLLQDASEEGDSDDSDAPLAPPPIRDGALAKPKSIVPPTTRPEELSNEGAEDKGAPNQNNGESHESSDEESIEESREDDESTDGSSEEETNKGNTPTAASSTTPLPPPPPPPPPPQQRQQQQAATVVKQGDGAGGDATATSAVNAQAVGQHGSLQQAAKPLSLLEQIRQKPALRSPTRRHVQRTPEPEVQKSTIGALLDRRRNAIADDNDDDDSSSSSEWGDDGGGGGASDDEDEGMDDVFEPALQRLLISMLLKNRRLSAAECVRRICACDFSDCQFPCLAEQRLVRGFVSYPYYRDAVRHVVHRLHPLLQPQYR